MLITSGVLGFLAHILPLTYSVDLARAIFYWDKPEYGSIVLYSPLFDLAVIAAFFVVFSVVGMVFFTRAERNR